MRRVIRIGLILIFGCLFFGFALHSGRATGQGSLWMIDVGQGDALLLRDGAGFDVLVDGGPSTGGEQVLQLLRDQGVSELDLLVVTHAHLDHIGGLLDVLQANDIAVNGVLTNGCTTGTAAWNNFVAAVSSRGLTLQTIRFPAELQWGTMQVYVLHPAQGTACSSSDANRDSLVLRIVHTGWSALLTGDVDATIEATVVARQTPVAADVLKVAHHGSAYASSPSFLAAVAPDHCLIPVGPNSYGHPDADTLSRLGQACGQLWRTDWHGDLFVQYGAGGVKVFPGGYAHQVFLPVILAP